MISLKITCPKCGADAIIRDNGPHREARCSHCHRHIKNVSKAELGEPKRSATLRGTIKPGQRSRIIQRAKLRCECCGRPASATGVGLHIGHVVGIEEGTQAGVSAEVLNSDENLIAECEECNLGHGRAPLPMSVFIAILMARKVGIPHES